MSGITEKIKILEQAYRILYGLMADPEAKVETVGDAAIIEKAARLRALWQEVDQLEQAEKTYRQQTAEIARARGVDVARLVMVDATAEVPAHFILTAPTLDEAGEARIADGLRKVIQLTMGGVFMEHEALKATMAAIIMSAGNVLPECDDKKKKEICAAMTDFDLEELAQALGLGDGGPPPQP